MTLSEIIFPALLYGAIISLVMTAMILITFRWNSEMWVHDAPPKIRDRYGPVIDWLVVATLKPKALLIPGTEAWEGYEDYAFYFRGFLKGLIGITLASAVLGGAAAFIGRLAG